MDNRTKQLILDYQLTFGSDHGKRVRDDLATRLNFHASFASIVAMGPPENTTLELGKREAYLYILDKLEADPNAAVQEVADMEVSNVD